MDIIDLLSRLLNAEYISMLPTYGIRPEQARCILELPEDAYTLEDYRRLACYITHDACEYADISEAKAAIVRAMLSPERKNIL